MKELLYNAKKRIKKAYRDYLTVDGTYTCILPDKVYLKKLYKKKMGKDLDLRTPKTFNEKLNWLKLYDRRPEYTTMVDKYAVREYLKNKIEQEGMSCSELGLNFIPLIGVWDRVEDIDFDSLPDQFVLKCNHDNGVIICKDKSKLDIKATKHDLSVHLNRDYYKKEREWPYKNVKRKIIAEEYMCDDKQPSLIDYKFFCFNGEVKAMFIATDRPFDTRFDYFDSEFNHLSIINGHPNSDKHIEKPISYDKMLRIAELLSQNIPHVRVDLYEINGKVYFGEMTLSHFGGFVPFEPDVWNYTFGEWITLPPKQ